MAWPVVRWLVCLEVLGLLGVPFVWRLCPRHADLGCGIGRVLVLLLLTYVVFIAGAAGVSDRGHAAQLAAAAVAGVAVILAYRQRRDLARAWRAQHTEMALSETVFLVTWVLFLVPLLFTDTSRYGERALDLAFLNALSLPGPLPPGNPYLGGVALNYYYYGHLMFASLTALLGLRATESYLLATATVAALTAAAVASVLSRLVRARAGRLVGLFLTCFSMNLAYARGWITGLSTDTFARSNWMVGNAINEYPLYTFLIAELHAHAMVLPAFVTTLALIIALSDCMNDGSSPGRLLATGGAGALVLGSVGPTSTWSMITLSVVGFVVLLATRAAASEWTLRRAARESGLWVAIVATAVLLYVPYYVSLQPLLAWPKLVGPLTSEPLGFTLHWGVFLWIVLGWGLLTFLGSVSVPRLTNQGFRNSFAAGAVCATVAAAWVINAVTSGQHVLPLAMTLVATVASAAYAWRSRQDDNLFLSWLFAALGFLIIGCCEVVYLDDYLSGNLERATTVFKFYLDAWVLLGVGTAYPVYVLGRKGLRARGLVRVALVLWAVPLALAALSSVVYTVVGVVNKTGGFRSGPYLSAVHFMDAKDRGYADAMRWLAQQPVDPAHRLVVAEAVDEDRETDWLSVAAPVEAYVAWPQQLVQWNYSVHEIRPRLENLQRLYTPTDPAQACALMTVEGIDLVFFGAKERLQFGREAEAKFLQPPFRTVFSSNDSALFECRLR